MQRTSDNHYILISSYPECHFCLYFHRHRHAELSNDVLTLHICIEFSYVVGSTHSGSHHLDHKSTCYVHFLMSTEVPSRYKPYYLRLYPRFGTDFYIITTIILSLTSNVTFIHGL